MQYPGYDNIPPSPSNEPPPPPSMKPLPPSRSQQTHLTGGGGGGGGQDHLSQHHQLSHQGIRFQKSHLDGGQSMQ